jgi:uncharacterized OsmC-like protein
MRRRNRPHIVSNTRGHFARQAKGAVPMSQATVSRKINGVDPEGIKQLACTSTDARSSAVGFAVNTRWKGGVSSESRVDGYTLAGKPIRKDFSILIDEPCELCGQNAGPNPQEMLMASLNACMLVGFVAGATMQGIQLTQLEIESKGTLDVRGFLGTDSTVKPGYDTIHYVVRISGNGTEEQFRKIHENVIATSPNRWNIANPVKLTSELILEW